VSKPDNGLLRRLLAAGVTYTETARMFVNKKNVPRRDNVIKKKTKLRLIPCLMNSSFDQVGHRQQTVARTVSPRNVFLEHEPNRPTCVIIRAMCIAVWVWSVIGPVRIRETPEAKAMKMISCTKESNVIQM